MLLLPLLALAGIVAAAPAGAAPTEASPEDHWLTQELTAAVNAMVAAAAITPAESKPPARPTEAAQMTPACEDIRTPQIPRLVSDIFSCRLAEAGWAQAEIPLVAAEAVTVAQCESLFDPAAVVFNGHYVSARHPATGMFYTAAGVFQFIRKSADRWIEGGYGHVHDAVRNIDAAARLYIHNRQRGFGGWDDWACAAANDGFRSTSVLPGWPGGPAKLPDWAWSYVTAKA